MPRKIEMLDGFLLIALGLITLVCMTDLSGFLSYLRETFNATVLLPLLLLAAFSLMIGGQQATGHTQSLKGAIINGFIMIGLQLWVIIDVNFELGTMWYTVISFGLVLVMFATTYFKSQLTA